MEKPPERVFVSVSMRAVPVFMPGSYIIEKTLRRF
jgi:hypothetical protein